MKTITLKSGQEMPVLGLGTWQLRNSQCQQAVATALKLGYRHIDTADAYGNHQDIAIALKKSGIPRQELFITSKIGPSKLHYQDLLKTGNRILKELELEYLDLLLIHWPNSRIPIKETFQALKELKEEGKALNIGVSNFTIAHLKEALEVESELITVNQVEFHPYLYQMELLDFCQDHQIVLTAYSPLARGKVSRDPAIRELAEKYDLNSSRLVLRWLVEKGIVVIPKASSVEHLKANLDIFDWDFPAEARAVLDGLNKDERIIDPPFAEFDRQ